MANWYYADGFETRGPVSEDEIRAMARRGDLTPNTYVVAQGDTVWVLLSDVEAPLGLARAGSGGYALAAPVQGEERSVAPAPTPAPRPGPTAGATGSVAGSGLGPLAGATPIPLAQPDPNPHAPRAQPSADPMARPFGEQVWGSPPPSRPTEDQPGWNAPAAPAAAETDRVAQPWGPPQGGPLTSRAYASWGQRVAAKLIDFLLLMLPSLLIALAVAWDDIRAQLERASENNFDFTAFTVSTRLTVSSVLGGLIGLGYYAYFNGRGQTPGKQALGIKVVRLNGNEPIGTTRGASRHVIQFFANVPFASCLALPFLVVDSLWPLWDGQKQALHDKIVGSVVIRTR